MYLSLFAGEPMSYLSASRRLSIVCAVQGGVCECVFCSAEPVVCRRGAKRAAWPRPMPLVNVHESPPGSKWSVELFRSVPTLFNAGSLWDEPAALSDSVINIFQGVEGKKKKKKKNSTRCFAPGSLVAFCLLMAFIKIHSPQQLRESETNRKSLAVSFVAGEAMNSYWVVGIVMIQVVRPWSLSCTESLLLNVHLAFMFQNIRINCDPFPSEKGLRDPGVQVDEPASQDASAAPALLSGKLQIQIASQKLYVLFTFLLRFFFFFFHVILAYHIL